MVSANRLGSDDATEFASTLVTVVTVVWAVVYSLLTIVIPGDFPHRALLADSLFLPAHVLAAWALWYVVRRAEPGSARRQGFGALFASQVIGVLNSLTWVASSAGWLPTNSVFYQLVGITTTTLLVYGIARLVPLRRPGIAAVPGLDILLLFLAGSAIGWYFVAWPLITSGAETGMEFGWFAAITSIDVFSALLALAAWTYPSERLGRVPAACLATAFALSAVGDVGIEAGTVAGTYVSGEPFDIIFAATILLIVMAARLELQPRPDPLPQETILLARAVAPTLASAAIMAPVFVAVVRGDDHRALVVPVALALAFMLLLQWRHLLLERGIERTIIARLDLERDLALARQFESLGRFAGSIAHDFNNILTSLLGHLQLLGLERPGSQESQRMLGLMEESVRRGATLNSRLLGLTRGHQAAPEPTDLGAVVRSVMASLEPVMAPRVRIVPSLPPAPLRVRLRPGDGDQLVLNLLVNARDAMPRGGPIYVRLREEGDQAVLEVEDEGTGIPPELRERIFEPLFTTKGERGTGLGLATVQAVLLSAGGTVSVWSEEGRGTRFTIRFPCERAA